MNAFDFAVLGAYLLGVLTLGAAFARRQKTGGEFFLAGRGMGWAPVGLSVMVTSFSAINYVGFSTEVFQFGLYVAISLPVFVLVAWPVTRVVMPFYHGMELTSAYEYLERRFDRNVRRLASGLFILWRLFWMAVALLATSRVLGGLTGLNVHLLILIVGAAATLYAFAGGMRAVMWTDVAQFGVLVGGLAGMIAVASSRLDGGFFGLVGQATGAGLTRPFVPFSPDVLSFDPRVRITIWSCLIGTFVAFLARYGADQVVLQRYFAARSLVQAQRGFWLNVGAAVLTIGSLALLGFAIRAHAAASGLGLEGPPARHFAALVASLPAGLRGLIAAGLAAATMSSVDSGANSCAAAILKDFRNSGHQAAEGRTVRDARLLTLCLGFLGVLMACAAAFTGQTVFVMANKIINGMGSPLLALFLLAAFSRRANSPGVLWGGALGAFLSAWVSFGVEGLALHYYAVANLLITLGLAYAGSLLARWFGAGNTPQQLAWTWRKVRSAPVRA